MPCSCGGDSIYGQGGVTDHHGLALLDEDIFNTYQSIWGEPWVLEGDRAHYHPTNSVVDDGPGAFVAPAILERGYNAWFGAPGYYVDREGVDRVIPDQYVHFGDLQPQIYSHVSGGGNPWDWIYGTFGSYGLTSGEGVRNWPEQAGEYSLS